MWTLPQARRAIIFAGCLGMAYTQLVMSPATIELARALGARGLHIGILGALPTGTLFLQFIAALVVNHLRYRRWLWTSVSLVQRMIFLPAALGPWLMPGIPNVIWVWLLILSTAANHALLNFCTPLWMSWMGDYLPREGLSAYWGRRQLWMQGAAAAALLAAAVLFRSADGQPRSVFALLITVACTLGVADILIFLRVEEPPVCPLPLPTLRRVLSAPFLDSHFRSFILHSCCWNVAVMVGAPFISLYLLEYLRISVAGALVLWACSWAGGAILSGWLGVLAERYGHRPLLILCVTFKSLLMASFLVIPHDFPAAFWLLAPILMVDALLNSGILIATNGFLLKNSPRENRTMFIAAGTALAGLFGGIASILAGAALAAMSGWSRRIAGVSWEGIHVLFLVSLVLRLATIPMAWRIREPDSRPVKDVVIQLIGATPFRVLAFPLGLYRGHTMADEGEAECQPLPERTSRAA